MTFGEKLTKLRKDYNYTQEQLADILGVSRQSVSKWESDIAYPETNKLIVLGRLFECSMDYLLKDEITEKDGKKTDDENVKEVKLRVMSDQNKKKAKKVLKIAGIVLGGVLAIDFISLIVTIVVYLVKHSSAI